MATKTRKRPPTQRTTLYTGPWTGVVSFIRALLVPELARASVYSVLIPSIPISGILAQANQANTFSFFQRSRAQVAPRKKVSVFAMSLSLMYSRNVKGVFVCSENVLSRGHRAQMFRVAACSIFAQVMYLQPRIDSAPQQSIHQAMNFICVTPTVFSGTCDDAISFCICRRGHPAARVQIDVHGLKGSQDNFIGNRHRGNVTLYSLPRRQVYG